VNVSGGNTTYTLSTGSWHRTPVTNETIRVYGFQTAGNNGGFTVISATGSTVVVATSTQSTETGRTGVRITSTYDVQGGSLYSGMEDSTFLRCWFYDNVASCQKIAFCTMTNCLWMGNTSTYQYGIYDGANIQLDNCFFETFGINAIYELNNSLVANSWFYGSQRQAVAVSFFTRYSNNYFQSNNISNGSYPCLSINSENTITGNQFGQNDFDNTETYMISTGGVATRQDNIISNNVLNAGKSGILDISEENNLIFNNSSRRLNNSTTYFSLQSKQVEYWKNTSGGSLAAGDVVVIKTGTATNEMTTTTTAGDAHILGMVIDPDGIANNASGAVLLRGKTALLKVDGTTNIAAGDYLTTFTTEKIAAKAASGQCAFAIACEAYTTDDSAGVLDAILISPRSAP
jgi:hypothetical protein